MTNDRVRDALEAAVARRKQRTGDEQKRIDMMLLVATHLLACCPVETLEGGTKHRWRRELQPAINAPGCACKGVPMIVFGPDHFLRELDKAA